MSEQKRLWFAYLLSGLCSARIIGIVTLSNPFTLIYFQAMGLAFVFILIISILLFKIKIDVSHD